MLRMFTVLATRNNISSPLLASFGRRFEAHSTAIPRISQTSSREPPFTIIIIIFHFAIPMLYRALLRLATPCA